MTGRMPWLGLALAALAWAAAHQVAADSIFDDCRRGSAGFILLVGLAALALDVAGGLFSLAVWRSAGGSKGRRFLGMLGMLLALLSGFAIALQSLSGLIIPSCSG
jgi:hypothetical protein